MLEILHPGFTRTLLGACLAAALQAQTAPLYTFNGIGSSQGEGFGQSVSAGDVDRDGVPDFLIGAPRALGYGYLSGYARLLSGADGSSLLEFQGHKGNDHFGWSVAIAGDLDGDGFLDLLVGAPGNDPNGPGSGSARAYSGKDGSVLYAFSGAAPGDQLGAAVSGAGDANADGFGDLLIGVPGDDASALDAGSALLISGSDGSVLHSWQGMAAGDALGTSVGDVGDVNADGRDDVAAGAPLSDMPANEAGSALVYSGKEGAVLYTFQGAKAGSHLGQSVSGAGDANHDGHADILIGSPQVVYSLPYPLGSVRLYSGADGSLLRTTHGDIVQSFGWSVDGAGDFNADGFPDSILGTDGMNGMDKWCLLSHAKVWSGRDGELYATFFGLYGADQFGRSVAGAGDVNGDGFDDVVVGAPMDHGNYTCLPGAGYVQVLPGAFQEPFPPQEPLQVLSGGAPYLYSGSAVDGAGDVDADGWADLLVGVPYDPSAAVNAGSARVYSGKTGALLHSIAGIGAQDFFGKSVGAAGDVDADGHADIIVGGPQVWTGVSAGALGYARVHSGDDGAVLYQFTGAAVGDYFGLSVAGAGDVNGDGFPDLIIGAQGYDTTKQDAGGAWVRSGKDGAVLHLFTGNAISFSLGATVSGAGDVNADGYADLLVGCLSNASTTSARVYSGKTGALLKSLTSGVPYDFFGRSLSAAGDVNADGHADVIVGAPQNQFYAGYPPTAPGSARVWSGAGWSLLYAFSGDSNGDAFGASVAGAGDADGDGYDDLIVGAPQDDTSGSFRGSAWVYSGRDGHVMRTLRGSANAVQFGTAVAGAGDVNGDGLPDVVIGAPRDEAGNGAGLPQAGAVWVYSVLPGFYGEGCPSDWEVPPVVGFTGGVPTVGGTGYAVQLLGAPPWASAALLAGFSDSSWGAIALPLELGPYGYAGCSLWVSVDAVLQLATDELGETQAALSVPQDPSLAGLRVHFQWAVAQPGIGLSFSRALLAVLGP